tara:strand:+ start:2778 stop:3902 length:1125 start_codon:yes stop_codon:yes gene_type:complete
MLLASTLLTLTGCAPDAPIEQMPAPVPVSVMVLNTKDLRLTDDLPGRVAAVRNTEIRAQVSGVVQRRLFEQGADVTAGTVLYQINPAPFQAEVDSAAAALQKAEAAQARSTLEAKRLAALTQKGVISRQAYDDALSLQHQAAADVALAKAALQRRRLDLQFASVEAPIAGRIDQTLISEGALVGPADSTPMARIQQIDQVYVDVRLPAAVLDTLYQQSALSQAPVPVEILSSSGTPLGMQGQILFSGINVDTGTGDVLLRVLVDNPEHRLLPGLYVKARLTLAHYKEALYVPEQAVSRVAGQATVWLLNGKNEVQPVSVELGELIDGHYRVVSGLSMGQPLVVEGIERLIPSMQVEARPWQADSAGAALNADAE